MIEVNKNNDRNMTDSNKSIYAICRINRGLGQEVAVEQLPISEVATLSRYENLRVPVPQEVVAAMIKVYKTPSLAWEHVLLTNPDLAPYLPSSPKLITDGDLMLMLELAADEKMDIRSILKEMLKSDLSCCEESEITTAKADKLRSIASKLMAAAGYLEERNNCSDE